MFINDHLGGHPAKLEEIDFLPIQLQDARLRVGQSDEWQVILFPVFRKSFPVFRSNHHNDGLPFIKLIVVQAQLRHVFLAEGSGEPTVENQ